MQSADCCHICNADFGMRHYLIVLIKLLFILNPIFYYNPRISGEFNQDETFGVFLEKFSRRF
jgi:hypothetical protein